MHKEQKKRSLRGCISQSPRCNVEFQLFNNAEEIFATVCLEIEKDRKCELHIDLVRRLTIEEGKKLFAFLWNWQKGLLEQGLVSEFYAIIPLAERSAQKLAKSFGWERAKELDEEDGLGFRKVGVSNGQEKTTNSNNYS
jgi:hypothetical protein